MAAGCEDKDFLIETQRRQIQSLQVESETLRKERDELLARLRELSALLEKKSRPRTKRSPVSPPRPIGGERDAVAPPSELAFRNENAKVKLMSGSGRLVDYEVCGGAAANVSTPTVYVSQRDTAFQMSESSCKKRQMGHSSTMPSLASKCLPYVASSSVQCSDPLSLRTAMRHDANGSSVRHFRASTHLPLPPAAYRGAPCQQQVSLSGDFSAVFSHVPAAGEQSSVKWPQKAACEAMRGGEHIAAVMGGQQPGEQAETSSHRSVPHRSAALSCNGATSFETCPSAAAVSRGRTAGRPATSTAARVVPTASAEVIVPADVDDAVAAAAFDDVLSPPSPYNSSTTDDSSDDELVAPSGLPTSPSAAAGQASATAAASLASVSNACDRIDAPTQLINGSSLDGGCSSIPPAPPSIGRTQTLDRNSGATTRQRRGSSSGGGSERNVGSSGRGEALYPESPGHIPTSSSHDCIRNDLMQSATAAAPDVLWESGGLSRRRSSAPSPWSAALNSSGSVAPSDPQSCDDWFPRAHYRGSVDGVGGANGRQHRSHRHRRYHQRRHQVSYCRYCSSSGGSCRHSSSTASAEVEEICASERADGGDTDEAGADSSDSSSAGSDDGDDRADLSLGRQEDVDRGGMEAESYRRAGSVGANRLAEVFVVVQPTRTGLVSERERKRQYRIGLNLFNRKPELGIRYLVEHRFLENSAQAVAHFLLNRKGLSRLVIGEYLGNLQQAFNQDVLRYFVQEVDIVDLELDEALRKFVSLFQLPGEAQKIERIMEMFAQQYCLCNPDVVKNFKSPDMVFLITFSIIMLNTDLHNPNIKSHRRMKVDNFIANVKGIDGGDDLSPQFLRAIYHRIRDKELRTGVDHTTQVRKVEETMVGKCPMLSVPWRRLVCYCRLYEVRNAHKRAKPGSHQREVFLFNDVLVVTKIFAKKKGCITYSFRESLDLSDLLVSPFETECYQFGIHLLSKSDHRLLMLFNARNEHDREKFVEDVGESIREVCETDTLLAREELRRTTSLGKFSKDSGCVADVEFTKTCGNSALGRQEDATSSVIDCVSAVTLSSERLHCNSLTDLSCTGVPTT